MSKDARAKTRASFGDRILWLMVAAYAVILTALGVIKYQTHHNLVDFGIFAQTVTSACFCNTVEGTHWAFHFSPILYLPALLLAAWKSPYLLIALPPIACALTAPPIYALVRARADANLARLAAAVVLLYPPLLGLAFVDFHENAFAPAAVAWMIWAFDAGYLHVAGAFALLTLAVKEDQQPFLLAATVAGIFAYRETDQIRMRWCIRIALWCVAAFAGWEVIRSHADGSQAWQPTRFYNWTPADFATLFPRGVLERLGFFVFAFAPLAFAPFRSRWLWLAALPLAEVLLSRMSTTYTMGTHYTGAWAGYVLVAFAFGIVSLKRPNRALIWSIALCALVIAVANPLHPGLNLRAVQARDRALDTYLATLPHDAQIATQEEAYTHLALFNPSVRPLPERPQAIPDCFILVDRDFPQSPRLVETAMLQPDPLILRGYDVAQQAGSITLYGSPRCGRM